MPQLKSSRYLTWWNAALVLLLSMMAYRVVSIRHVRGPESGILPSITMRTLDGEQISLENLRGKAVLLNFWATWCGPCRLEVPWLQKIADKHAKEGLVVIGVLQDDAPDAAVKALMADHHAHYLVVHDSGEIAEQMGGITGLPTTFYIGRNGTIVHSVGGLVPEMLMESYARDAQEAFLAIATDARRKTFYLRGTAQNDSAKKQSHPWDRSRNRRHFSEHADVETGSEVRHCSRKRRPSQAARYLFGPAAAPHGC